MSAPQFKFGDTVKSVAVGKRSEFVGTVTYVGKTYYHVRDDDGYYWHRDASELKHIAERVEAAA